MSDYQKIGDAPAASALGGTEQIEAVQSSATVYLTPAQMATYVHANPPAGVTATSVILHEYIFDEDAELDYSGSLSNGMASAQVVFTELPATTKMVWVSYQFNDTGAAAGIIFRRSFGGTATHALRQAWADGGTNSNRALAWIPTDGNSIYVTTCAANTTITFLIVGYKTGS